MTFMELMIIKLNIAVYFTVNVTLVLICLLLMKRWIPCFSKICDSVDILKSIFKAVDAKFMKIMLNVTIVLAVIRIMVWFLLDMLPIILGKL